MTHENSKAAIIPTLRYRDANAAIDWLKTAFGFSEHLVVADEDGGIAHAQLILGNGMIMLGTARDDEFGKLQQPPADRSSAVTQSPYIVVSEIDAFYARACAAGAEVVMPLKEEDYGGKVFACRDPEGFVWNFGSYDPWS